MYDYFSIEGFKQFGMFYLIMGLGAFLFFYDIRKQEKNLKIWFFKVLAVGIVSATLMYSINFYFDGKDYNKQIQYCENKEDIMIDRKCYKPIGDNRYIKADTTIVTLKKE